MKKMIIQAAALTLLSAGIACAQTNSNSNSNTNSNADSQKTVRDSTQTQGNSAGGTAAWPQATGTAGSTRMSPAESGNTSSEGTKSNDSQSQGNSAQGTSAWPQATGTVGTAVPETDSSAAKINGERSPQTAGESQQQSQSTDKSKKKKSKPNN